MLTCSEKGSQATISGCHLSKALPPVLNRRYRDLEDKIDSSKSIIENLRDTIGVEGNLFVEKVSQLTKDKLQPSSFHKIFYGYIDVTPSIKQLNDAILDQLIKLVRPKGQLFIKNLFKNICDYSHQYLRFISRSSNGHQR
uniref:Anamorsin N-terminal domain-containing protein n=1 Tax=Tetranychus urticae TaxID=32264 RepID=T1L527_TETUR